MTRKPKYKNWHSKSMDDGQHIDVDISHDSGTTDILIEAHVLKSEWEKFDKYCLRYGHGEGGNAIAMKTASMIYQHAADWTLDDNLTKTYFSPYFKTWTERLTRYLVLSHITIIAISYLNFLIVRDINYFGYLSTYIYVISLAIALICWFLIGIRNSFLDDKSSLTAAAERSFLIWSGRHYWILWITSALLLLAASLFRLVSFLLTVRPDTI